MSKEALKLALEALERMERFGNTFGYRSWEQNPYEQVCEAITAIKQALAAPVQEPVGWMTQARCFVHLHEFTEAEAKLYGWTPVYTTPPAAPDLQAELDATNRQVEILSDAPITEYLPILHEGYAGQRAMSQLVSMANSASIVEGGLNVQTMIEMVQNLNNATPPKLIEFRKDGKFFRVMKRSWE